ncbi:MAG: flagellar biosynthetic protein FliR [Lachnospiraceae bacterium]|nr:flagellar biosynthetic protein FliR [Lachnospiraceae bacterium]MDE6627042.1 flagellar biosynthetic protein FliR [Lachnospiraceae bacterium]
MLEQSFSIYHLEYFLAIVVRVMGAMAFAPIFGNVTVTRRVRILLSIAAAFAIFAANPYVPLNYNSFLEYTILLLKELVVGLSIGFVSNITLTIIGMAGQFIDREMGFSMVSAFDQSFNTDTTITAEFYSMLVRVIMLVSNLHYYILSALSDSFVLIPIGNVKLDSGRIYDTMLQYMVDYFLIALRIGLPIMIAIVLLNVILGVLAKTAPQMSMFVIGIQLKIFVGFGILVVTIPFLSNITGYVYEQMQKIVMNVLQAFY